jgi:hypothetical protein
MLWVAGGAHKTAREKRKGPKNGAFVKSSISHNAGGALCLKFCFEYCSNTTPAVQRATNQRSPFSFSPPKLASKINIPLLLGDRHRVGPTREHTSVFFF